MFIAINTIVSLFFVILIYLGFKFHVYSFIPVNFVGIVVSTFAVIYEVRQQQDPLVTLFMLLLLLVVFASDFVISMSRITEKKILKHRIGDNDLYLKIETPFQQIKLIGSAASIQREIQLDLTSNDTAKLQALEQWIRGNYSLAKKDYAAAIPHFQRSLEHVNTFAAALNLAGTYLLTNQPELTLTICDEIFLNAHDPGATRINQSIALTRLNQFDGALENLEQATHAGARFEDVCLLKVNIFILQGKIDAALAILETCLQENPDIPDAWYQKGRCLLKIGKPQQAKDCFAQVIKLNPQHYEAWYCQGNLLNRKEQYMSAITHYDAALKINPEFNEAWNNKGISLCRLGRFHEGLICYENALKIKSDYLEAWINKGLACEDSGDYEQAISSYRKFLELAPQSMTERIRSTQRRVVELKALLKQNAARSETDIFTTELKDGWQESNSMTLEKELTSESDCI